MRMYLISDNVDTQVGMRLAGVEGVVVHGAPEVLKELQRVCADENVGIVLMTSKLVDLCRDEVYAIKQSRQRPLIVEIPDRHGETSVGAAITSYIREAVGINI